MALPNKQIRHREYIGMAIEALGEDETDYIHTLITDTELNNLLNQFIDNDQFKALYAILSIQNQI